MYLLMRNFKIRGYDFSTINIKKHRKIINKIKKKNITREYRHKV